MGNTQAAAAQEVENVIIRFAGDSGDGIQVTGGMFTHDSAILGNDISTLPDFPAEIRAPAGTLAGVSSFQLNFSSYDIHTPGDQPDVLVAMNPAAVKAHIADLRQGAILIINEDAFNKKNFKTAGIDEDPRTDGSLSGYQVFQIPITGLTGKAVEPVGLSKKQAELCKNMYTLGLVCWLYERSLDAVVERIDAKYGKRRPELAQANQLALQAGYNYADTLELFASRYRVVKAELPAGNYRRISGNQAAALGLIAGSQLAERDLFYGSYPITPASDILHELSRLRHFGVRTFQAEDEMAAIGASIGAAFGGGLAATGTSGPGLALKSEALGLAVMTELPLVVVNVQRGGPSTGLPTKSEQSDLLQAYFGRNGECPVVIVAPSTPSDCFEMMIEACRLALKYMTPVIYLSDGYLANGSEPWRLPEVSELPDLKVANRTDPDNFLPYARDPETLARPWAVPGTPGLEHRIGGLEKQDLTGNVSYDPLNHEKMINLRAAKVAGIAKDIPALETFGPDRGELLVLGWGSSAGAIRSAVENAQQAGATVAYAHIRYMNPMPLNVGEVLKRYHQVLLPELNSGQLRMLLRAEHLVDIVGLNKLQGQPFKVAEIEAKIEELIGRKIPKGTRASKLAHA